VATTASRGGDAESVRVMLEEDLVAGERLCRVAGWNQGRADWTFFLQTTPNGCFVAQCGQDVVGTVTTINYGGQVGWVAMVLVDPDVRGQGIGGLLLQTALRSLESCASVKLDATPAGKRVYDKLGFVDEYTLSRMTVFALTGPIEVPPVATRPMRAEDLSSVVRADSAAFGVERRTVIEWLWRMAPEYAWVAEDRQGVTGFCLGRHGQNFEHIGPVTAGDLDSAKSLLACALHGMRRQSIMLDVPQSRPSWQHWLESLGFREERPFIRMYCGPNHHPGRSSMVFAIAGPELG
jgi:ribosomal protein S18 acetylase RimI-like enzyme